MGKESFIIYKSFYPAIEDLSDEDLGALFRSLFEYQITGKQCENKSISMAFKFFKNQFRLDEEKYLNVVERNRINGNKGGRKPKPKETEPNPKNPMGYSKPKKADNDNDNETDNDNELKPINIEYAKFNEWLKDNARNVLSLKEPITEDQFIKLKQYDRILLKDTLIAMHNFKDLKKKYVSAYLTLTNWIKRNNNTNIENGKSRIDSNIEVAKLFLEQSRNNGL
jgi:hypothetical protein